MYNKPKILSFNTIFENMTILLHLGDEVVYEKTINDGNRHSEMLLPLIGEALGAVNLDYPDLDAISSLSGPGNFTGIKVGMAALKTLTLLLNKPVILSDLFDVLAYGQGEGKFCTILRISKIKYYVKINGGYRSIPNGDMEEFLAGLEGYEILTNTDEITLGKRVDFSLDNWVGLTAEKYRAGDFDAHPEALYIDPAQVTARKCGPSGNARSFDSVNK